MAAAGLAAGAALYSLLSILYLMRRQLAEGGGAPIVLHSQLPFPEARAEGAREAAAAVDLRSNLEDHKNPFYDQFAQKNLANLKSQANPFYDPTSTSLSEYSQESLNAETPSALAEDPVQPAAKVKVTKGQLRGGEKVIKIRFPYEFTKAKLMIGPNAFNPAAFGKLDAALVDPPLDLDFAEPHYLLGWQPVVAKHTCPDGSEYELIHHIDFMVDDKDWWDNDNTFMGAFLATHDRGGHGFRLPAGYGIPIPDKTGPQTRMQYHYLTPTCLDFERTPVVHDESGMDIIVTTTRPQALAWYYAFVDQEMVVPKHSSTATFDSVLPTEKWALVGKKGQKEVIAIHMHTHDLFQEKRFEVLNADGSVAFASPPEPGGYSVEAQTFQTLTQKGWPRLPVREGQSLRMRCTQTGKSAAPTYFGLSHGTEMCTAALIIGGVKGGSSFSVLSSDAGGMERMGRLSAFLQAASREWKESARAGFRSLMDGFRRLL